MHGGVKELFITLCLLSLTLLSVDIEWTLTKGVRSVEASILLHAVVCYTIILTDYSPVAVRDLLNKTSNPACLSLRKENSKLEVRRSFCTLLELPNCIDTLESLMHVLQEVMDRDVLVVVGRVVNSAYEPHALGCLLRFRGVDTNLLIGFLHLPI